MSDDTTFGPCPFCGSTNTTYHVYPQYFAGAWIAELVGVCKEVLEIIDGPCRIDSAGHCETHCLRPVGEGLAEKLRAMTRITRVRTAGGGGPSGGGES